MENLFLGIFVYGLFIVCLSGIRFRSTPGDELDKNTSLSLRGIGMYLIILVHAIPRENIVTFFYLVTGIAGVGICLFLSGFGLYKSYSKKGDSYWNNFLVNKFLRMLIPYCIVYPINLIINVIRSGGKSGFITKKILFEVCTLQMNGAPLWYLKIQLLLYLIFFICFRCSKKFNILSVTILVLLYMLIGGVFGIGRFWYDTSVFFPIGLIVAKYEKQVILFLRKTKSIIGSAILCSIVFGILYLWGHLSVPVLIDDSYTAAIIAFLIGISMHLQGTNILRSMGKISMEIYLVHIFLLQQGCFGFFDSLKGYTYLILFGATIIFSFLLHLICERLQKKVVGIYSTKDLDTCGVS